MATLLLVHAHPDDESIATGGLMLRASGAGHRVVLVTCTRGEEGEIHNLDEATTRPRLGEVRTEELRRAGALLGVARQVFLGYRDSGMAGRPANADPGSFHQADLGAAAERLARVLREERPAVVVTYTPDGTYGHPDHIKAHEVTLAALDILAGEGWEPARTYLHAIPKSLVASLAAQAAQLGLEPSTIALTGIPDEEVAAVIDVRDLAPRKLAAFAAHTSQNNPRGPLAGMAGQILEAAFGAEHFVLARGARSVPAPAAGLLEGL